MFFYRSVRCFRPLHKAGDKFARVFIVPCSSSVRDGGDEYERGNQKREKGEGEQYDYHVPVMRDECCRYLLAGPFEEKGVFVDCTVGGGGHTKAILERGGKVIGFDQDPEALAETSRKLSVYIESGQLELVHTNFRNIANAVRESKLAKENGGVCNGILMDLGVSSHQINEPRRGFAFAADGPLDMRMGGGRNLGTDVKNGEPWRSSSLTAATICNEFMEDDIANILYNYGDETRSRKLAREIVAMRPISTTKELVEILSRVTPFKERTKILARCFQALRIAVNDEMGALDKALEDAHKIIRPGGRLVVLSYHSLEDRRVKRLIKTGKTKSDYSHKAISYCSPWNSVFKKVQTPTQHEIEKNSRARSAKLRVAERISVGEELTQGHVFLGSTSFGKKNKYKTGIIGNKEKRKAVARGDIEDEF